MCAGLAVPIGTRAADDGLRRAGHGMSLVLPAAVLGSELWRGDSEGARQFGHAFVATVALTEVLKRVTDVERPDHSNHLSFPSGDAARAFAAAGFVHRRHGFAQALPLYALATWVGETRVQSQRHRWGDVAGAAAVALAMNAWLVDRAPAGGSGRSGQRATLLLAFAL